jgi:hypothetical protein
MVHVEAYRQIVVARAGGACEYCRLVEAATGVTFHIEHIVPQVFGGETVLSNLALSCPGCNLAKGQRTKGRGAAGTLERLFNPRSFDPWLLGWHMHFQLDRRTGIILPRTATGEVTVKTLSMNGPKRVFARRLQIKSGLIG